MPAVLLADARIHVLVVDDNSPDGTGTVAREIAEKDPRINFLGRRKKEGLGRAYVAGFRWAIERKFDYIVEMDADFSHSTQYLKQHLSEIEEHDVVIGSRYISGVNVVNWPLRRLLLSYFANQYVRFVAGVDIWDATSGFKCFRRNVLEAIDFDGLHSSGYAFQIEVNLLAAYKGFRIKEIPIIFYERRAGSSKMSMGIVGEAVWLVWWLRMKSLLRLIK